MATKKDIDYLINCLKQWKTSSNLANNDIELHFKSRSKIYSRAKNKELEYIDTLIITPVSLVHLRTDSDMENCEIISESYKENN